MVEEIGGVGFGSSSDRTSSGGWVLGLVMVLAARVRRRARCERGSGGADRGSWWMVGTVRGCWRLLVPSGAEVVGDGDEAGDARLDEEVASCARGAGDWAGHCSHRAREAVRGVRDLGCARACSGFHDHGCSGERCKDAGACNEPGAGRCNTRRGLGEHEALLGDLM